MTTVKNIYDYINSIAPFDTQEEWDNSGHLVGDFRKEVKKVVMALDPTKDVANYAKQVDADLLLTHHPIIFGGINNVLNDSAVYMLANNSISAICAHTNFDKSDDGINFNLAKILGLKDTYRPNNDFTVIGKLDNPIDAKEFAKFIKKSLNANTVLYTDSKKEISTVAVGGGACGEFIDDMCKQVDCFVTSDIKHHQFIDASENGYCVISAGHYETENMAFLMLKNNLEKIFTDVEFIISPVKNPIMVV